MRHAVVPFVLLALAVALLVPFASPAGAADAKGCSATVTSFDANGGVVDVVRAPGRGGTKDDPFTLDPDGSVEYQAQTDAPIRNGEWKLESGIGISPSGDIGSSGDQDTEGSEELEQYLSPGGVFGMPVVSGLAKVDFVATGEDGATCTISGWIEIEGFSITSGVAAVLVLGALALAWLWARPTPARGLVGR